MAFHRKVDAVLEQDPDIAVICECAEPALLRDKSQSNWMPSDAVWVGDNRHKGLGVFGFNGFKTRLFEPHYPKLRHIAPVHVSGPVNFNLLAAWAQNASGDVIRKRQTGPLLRSLNRYRTFLKEGPVVLAGDLNSNTIWDKPGWSNNHMTLVSKLTRRGLISAYHHNRVENHGEEKTPTHYWRDRCKDGPTYHLDYAFVPQDWMASVRRLQVGSFEDWVGSGLSDHVPIIVDVDL